MEWIVTVALAVGGFALVAVRGLTAKRHDGESIPGRFDRYKSEELSNLGLFDKTKW